jgi:hypothetical protein
MAVRHSVTGRAGGIGTGELRVLRPRRVRGWDRHPWRDRRRSGLSKPRGVPNVEAALQRAESLGGARVPGPATSPSGLVVGHFTDPEGTVIGVAGVT